MHESLRLKVKEKLAPDEIWTMRPNIEEVLKSEINSLPQASDISKYERRYPTTNAALRTFLNAFFARHYFQIQDTVLQPDVFEKFIKVIRKGTLRIADIGSGPVVATLAFLDLITALNQCVQLPMVRVSIILNDTANVSLRIGQKMVRSFSKRSLFDIILTNIISVDTPFPKSLTQLRRVAAMTGSYDICCMSYVLNPLKQEMTHKEIQNNIQELLRYCSSDASCFILQDRFKKSLLRQTGRLQGVTSQKAALCQKVYDEYNSNTEYTYTFFRTIVAPKERYYQGVETRFCLQ